MHHVCTVIKQKAKRGCGCGSWQCLEWRLRDGDETNGRNVSPEQGRRQPQLRLEKSLKQLCRKLPHLLIILKKIFILFVVQNSENQNQLKPLERVEGGACHGPWDRNP